MCCYVRYCIRGGKNFVCLCIGDLDAKFLFKCHYYLHSVQAVQTQIFLEVSTRCDLRLRRVSLSWRDNGSVLLLHRPIMQNLLEASSLSHFQATFVYALPMHNMQGKAGSSQHSDMSRTFYPEAWCVLVISICPTLPASILSKCFTTLTTRSATSSLLK